MTPHFDLVAGFLKGIIKDLQTQHGSLVLRVERPTLKVSPHSTKLAHSYTSISRQRLSHQQGFSGPYGSTLMLPLTQHDIQSDCRVSQQHILLRSKAPAPAQRTGLSQCPRFQSHQGPLGLDILYAFGQLKRFANERQGCNIGALLCPCLSLPQLLLDSPARQAKHKMHGNCLACADTAA